MCSVLVKQTIQERSTKMEKAWPKITVMRTNSAKASRKNNEFVTDQLFSCNVEYNFYDFNLILSNQS